MGKLVRIEHQGSVVTMSMVKWGVIRRNAAGLLPHQPFNFTPRCETAIYDGPTTLSGNPYCTFYYCDQETAHAEWDLLAASLKAVGLEKTVKDRQLYSDPEKVGLYNNRTGCFVRVGCPDVVGVSQASQTSNQIQYPNKRGLTAFFLGRGPSLLGPDPSLHDIENFFAGRKGADYVVSEEEQRLLDELGLSDTINAQKNTDKEAIDSAYADDQRNVTAQKFITPEDEKNYGNELIELAKRAASEAIDPELVVVVQEFLSHCAALGGDITRGSRFPRSTRFITPEDKKNYGYELIDLAKRAAREAMDPELNTLRQEMLSQFAMIGDNTARSSPIPPPIKLITPEDEENYGNELIGVLKRAAREAVVPELNEIRQKIVSQCGELRGDTPRSSVSTSTDRSGAGKSETSADTVAKTNELADKTRTRAEALVESGYANLTNGQFDSALADFNEAIRLDPKAASAYSKRGVLYSVTGDKDRAFADFNEAIRLDPEDANAFYNRGISYDKGDYDRAIADFDEAIRLDANYDLAFKARGWAYQAKGQLDRAIADFNQAIKLNSKFAFFFACRGTAYAKKGDDGRAIVDFDEAIRLDPEDTEYYIERGKAYVRKREYDRAIADFNVVVRLNPKKAIGFQCRGGAYSAKNDYDKAVSDFDQAIKLDPKNFIALVGGGEAYLSKGDFDRAIANFDAAIELDSKDASLFFDRGRAYLRKGQPPRAILDLHNAIQLNPNDANFFAVRGKAYEDNGDYDHAIQDYDQAARLKQNYIWVINNRARMIAANRRWDYFRGKPNTDDVLEEKAAIVAHLIIETCEAGASFATDALSKFPDIRSGDDEVRQAQAEIDAFLYCLVARPAFASLGDGQRYTFISALGDRLAKALQDKGVEPQYFAQLLRERWEEYRHYQICDWEEKKKGELFWEFGKKISTVLCGFEHPALGIPLAAMMLKAFVEWKISELLPKAAI